MANVLSENQTIQRALLALSHAAPSRLLAATGLGLLSFVALIVMLRRMAGAFSGNISVFGYAGSLFVFGLICCVLKVIAEWPPHRLDRRGSVVFGVLVGLPLLVLAISLLPTAWTYTWLISAVAWSMLISWFCVSTMTADWLHFAWSQIVWPEIERFLFPGMERSTMTAPMVADAAAGAVVSLHIPPRDAGERESAGELISELQRRSDAQGNDLLEGQLVATFAAGARQTVLHVPFVPPFSVAPRFEFEVTDGTDVRVKVGAVFPYGARLELKRTGADLPELSVGIDVYAEVA